MKILMKKACLIIAALMLLSITACSSAAGKKASGENATAGATADNTAGTSGDGTGIGSGQASVIDMGKDDNTRITVASSDANNRFLEIAVKKFNELYPGIVVDIKQYSTMGEVYKSETEDGGSIIISKNEDPGGEKYIKTISTELMSGTGPDIINTFYIPCAKFADNGFLCDMEKFIEQDGEFDINNYYKNIFDAAKYKKGLYSMPLGFLTDMLAGKYSLPDGARTDNLTLDSFFRLAGETLGANGVGGTYVLNTSERELFENLFIWYYKSFVSEESRDCDFTSSEFVRLLKQIKDAADKKLIFKSADMASWPKERENLYFLMRSNYDSNYLSYFLNPRGGNNVYAMPSLDGKSGIGADIWWEYGINSNSGSKGAAWKFVKFLISEEMQALPEFYPFPVNKNAMAAKIKRERSTEAGTALGVDNPIFSKLFVYPEKNLQILKIAVEETEKYFNGQRSAEDTANVIQGRVNMMIKE
ncbi:MAG: extracellular solute-binding protein [Clostridiaceae bacterium]